MSERTINQFTHRGKMVENESISYGENIVISSVKRNKTIKSVMWLICVLLAVTISIELYIGNQLSEIHIWLAVASIFALVLIRDKGKEIVFDQSICLVKGLSKPLLFSDIEEVQIVRPNKKTGLSSHNAVNLITKTGLSYSVLNGKHQMPVDIFARRIATMTSSRISES